MCTANRCVYIYIYIHIHSVYAVLRTTQTIYTIINKDAHGKKKWSEERGLDSGDYNILSRM